MPYGVDDNAVGYRELVSFHRVSVQTTLVSGTVWPKFAIHVLTGGCQSPVWGRDGRMGSEIGPVSSTGTTSYRLPIATIGLSLTVFEVLRMFQTERQTDGRTELVWQ